MINDFGVLILNYNSASRVQALVDSLLAEGLGADCFYIIDNDSKDNHILKEYTRSKGLRFIQSSQNKGYAYGNHLGIDQALRDEKQTFLILNPDIEISFSVVQSLYDFIHSREDVFFVGPRICDKFDRNLIFSDGGLLFPEDYFRGDHVSYDHYIDEVEVPAVNFDIDYVNGSVLMFKKETLTLIGRMREDFFMYYEESEWCYRLKKHSGAKQAVLTYLRAYHEMSSKGNFYQFYITRNRLWLSRLHGMDVVPYAKNLLYQNQKMIFSFKGNLLKNIKYFMNQVKAIHEGVKTKLS